MLTKILIFLIILISLILIFDISCTVYRFHRRVVTFKRAKERKKETNKKLLVVGAPGNGFVNKNIYRAYDCGDVCTDLLGCSDCENSIKGDILEVLKKMDDNQYVIFESCVLEYLDDEKRLETEKEMTRVSGGDRFNVRMKPYILPDKFYCLPFVMC